MAEEHGHYDDRFFGDSEYPNRPHLLRGGGMGKEVYDVREDVGDAFSRVALEIDKGIGYGGLSISDATPSEDISGGANTDFGISVNGDAVEQVSLANVATLDSAAKIVAAINTALKKLANENNRAAKAYWYGGRYVISGPYDPDDPAGASVVISDGLANNVAANLKIGLANSGLEQTGSLSMVVDSLAGVGPSPSAYGSENIAGAATTAAVVFPTPMPDAAYAVVAVAIEDPGFPGLANVNVWITAKTNTGFTLNVSAAPGAGNNLIVDWIAQR